MKAHEIKMKLVNGANSLIDQYFNQPSVSDRLINKTLKVLVHQNQYKVDSVLKYFMDENGEIDPQYLLNEYADALGEDGIIFDLRNYIHNDFIKAYLPNKALKITKQDIINILMEKQPSYADYE